MKINVTQENINLGQKGNPSKCGLALAIKDLMPEAQVLVFHTHAEINNRSYKLPQEATKFIFAFDTRTDSNLNKELVSPIEFEISEMEIMDINVPQFELCLV